MMRLVYLTILLSNQVCGSVLPLSQQYLQEHALSQCVTNTIDCCVGYGEIIAFVVSASTAGEYGAAPFDHQLLRGLSETNKVLYIIKKSSKTLTCQEFRKRIGMYIIQMSEIDDLIISIESLSKEPAWNPHAKFIVIAMNIYQNLTQILADVTEIMWPLRLVNAVMLAVDYKNNDVYNVYTGHMHVTSKEHLEITTKLIDTCYYGKTKTKEWFSDKTPENFMGYKLKVRTNIIEPFVMFNKEYNTNTTGIIDKYNITEGLEVKLLNTVAEYVNLTLDYSLVKSPDTYGKFYPNGTFSGAYLDLSRKEVDLIMGYVVSRPETQKVFDTITSHLQDSLVFCVAKAKKVQDWVKVTASFDNPLVILYILLYFIISVIVNSSSKLHKEEIREYRNLQWIWWSMVQVILGVSLFVLPKSGPNRFLLLFAISCAFFYRTLFVTFAIKMLSNSQTAYQIQTTKDIFQTMKTVQYYPLCKRFADKEEMETIKMEICENYFDCLNRTTLSKQIATCMPKLNVKYLFGRFLNKDGHPQLYYLKNNIVTYPIEMLMWKGHPLKPRINELVTRLSAGGFIYKWRKDLFDDLLLHTKMNSLLNSEEIILKLSHLTSPLLQVVILYVIAIIVLFTEIIVYRLMERRRRNYRR